MTPDRLLELWATWSSDPKAWAQQIASDIWDRPAIETREELEAALLVVMSDLIRREREDAADARDRLHEHVIKVMCQEKAGAVAEAKAEGAKHGVEVPE